VNTAEKIKWAAIGWALLLGVKYLIVGLDDWNAVLHPGLQTAPNQEMFRKPLLGLFGGLS
jgi:hypothetical protein